MGKKILLTGATGLIGRAINECLFKDHEVICTSSSPTTDIAGQHFAFDLKLISDIPQFLETHSPEVVIHTAAITSVDYAELHHSETHLLNVIATEAIAKWCQISGARLIYFSTDFVFDGKRDNYCERDKPNPLSYYGKTKLISEEFIASLLDNYAIIRPVLVYGSLPNLPRLNFPLLVEAKLSQGQSMNITADQFRKPTYVFDVAKITDALIEPVYNGIVNISGSELVNMYEFATMVAERFNLDKKLLIPIETKQMRQAGKRPMISGFDNALIDQLFGFKPTGLIEGIDTLYISTVH